MSVYYESVFSVDVCMELPLRITSVALVNDINNADLWPCSAGDVRESCTVA